jgi:hypothetical protein
MVFYGLVNVCNSRKKPVILNEFNVQDVMSCSGKQCMPTIL